MDYNSEQERLFPFFSGGCGFVKWKDGSFFIIW